MPYLTATDVRSRVERTASVDPLFGYTDEAVDELIAEFEEVAEDYLGFSCVPRTATEVVSVASFSDRLVLARPKVRSVTSVTIDGVALAAASYETDLAAGVIRRVSGGMFSPADPATVVYVHGLTEPPVRIKRACALYVASVAESEKSGTSRNVLSQGMDGGTTRYSTPDKRAGRPTGWLEVDRLLNSVPRLTMPGIG